LLSYPPLALGGALAGAGLICLSALVLGPPGSALAQLDRLQERLVSIRPAAAPARIRTAISAPSFSLFGQSVPVTVTLQGVSMSPGRRAALVSVGGAAAEWLDLGQTRDGITLIDVRSSSVTVDTDGGTKEIQFAQGSSGPAAVGPAPSQTTNPPIQPRFGTASNSARPFAYPSAAGSPSARPQAGAPNMPPMQIPSANRAPG
jgi:hypothetical protein